MIMCCKARCVMVKGKTKANGFSTLQVGDVMTFSVEIKRAGGGYRGTHATYIECENTRTGEKGGKSFNEIGNILNNFKFQQID